jgi:hypothetical protein
LWPQGLRQLVANYVRLHAKDPIVGPVTGAAGAGAVSNALTLESWALAISGAVNIEEYCQQHISSMQKDTSKTQR